jgi:NADH-quinone oxidoreductase subunit G
MITIYIDNKPHQVRPDQNLLQACLTLGFDLPYFCWHPALHSVGACRQCAVKLFKDEHDSRGRIVMSCMTPVTEGMRISVDDPEAKAFRKGVIEWLMLNHPHDCPVCDEGGECHLQDMTVMTGHARRRSRFRKRTHRNQDLGPFINHEMNRCIQCYRCVRFYRGVAGGRDLNVFASHDHVYFGRHEDGVLESEFSGNLVEVCPTGVFTDRTLKEHYTRKWDLQTAPSLCVHCGLGCNTIAAERYGTLRRVLNRYHREVNGYFLCDRGRFGYEFVNSGKRISVPMLSPSPPSVPHEEGRGADDLAAGKDQRSGRVLQQASKHEAVARVAEILARSSGVIGIGSPRASLESNFALRSLVGQENFYSGMSGYEHRLVTRIIDDLRHGPARTPSLREVGTSDAVLILGEDVTNTAPLLALALRRSVRGKEFEAAARINVPEWNDAGVRNASPAEGHPLFIASLTGTKLDDIAARTFRAAPDDIARLGFAVAHAVSSAAPEVPGLTPEARALALEIAAALTKAERPVIIAGASLLNEAVIEAAANVAWALYASGRTAGLCYTVPECNSLGLGLMGGRSIDEAFTVMQDDLADTVIVLENDLYRRSDAGTTDAFLGRAKQVIVLDHILTATSARADIVLPTATFSESTGTLVNNEGRAQRYYQVFVPPGDIQAGWTWMHAIMEAAGTTAGAVLGSFDDLEQDMASALPLLAPAAAIAPSAGFRTAGQKVPRQPHRYSGRTSMLANIAVSEPKPPEDPDSPLSFSMEGSEGQPPSPLIGRYWSPGWNSVQALNKFQQEVGGPLRGDDPGRRLVEPSGAGKSAYHSGIPEAFRPKEGEWLLVPLHNVFGSEELSFLAPGIAALAPKPSLAVCPEDAAKLGVVTGGIVELSCAGIQHHFRVLILPGIPAGTAGFPAGSFLPASAEGRPFGRIARRTLA